jgi:hypothetical protein
VILAVARVISTRHAVGTLAPDAGTPLYPAHRKSIGLQALYAAIETLLRRKRKKN